MKDLIDFLNKKAGCELYSDSEDFNPYEQFDGNMDDAYWGGTDDGEIYLARAILEKFFGPSNIPGES